MKNFKNRRHRILVVDDEKMVRELLERLLTSKGYEVVSAKDAVEARSHMAHEDFDLILCDIRMPGESGLELIRDLSTHDPSTATVMITGVDDPQTADVALQLGVYGYLIKPFESKQVLITVANALRRQELERQRKEQLRNLEEKVALRTSELEQTVSDLKRAQAQMIQSEKMASIGQLASGVAHEINNPTGYISSNLSVLADYMSDFERLVGEYRKLMTCLKEGAKAIPSEKQLNEHVERILCLESEIDADFILEDTSALIHECKEGTERINKIVLDLKNFAHPGKDELEYADINANLDSTLNVVWNELKYKAKVTKDYGELPEVFCRPQQLNQVFMNLLVNAAQAIEKKGKIHIETRPAGDAVRIRIADTGSGIPEANLPKIFDPFFTTKEVGKGTGLGLNVAYNIVKKHGGTIHVESRVGKGTAFTIELPVKGSCSGSKGAGQEG